MLKKSVYFLFIIVCLIISCKTENTIFPEEVIKPPEEVIKSLHLVTPNGGEEFYVGDSVSISWESSNISNLKISYSIDSGLNWRGIKNSINSQNKSIMWKIPDSLTTKGLVKIESVEDSVIKNISNNYFAIEYKLIENLKYYPMHIGDEWRYFTTKWSYWTDSTTLMSTEIVKIIRDTTMSNGKRYFVFQNSSGNNNSFQYRRIDSLNALVYSYEIYESQSWNFSLPNGSSDNRYMVLEGTFNIKYLNFIGEMKSFEHRANTYIIKYYFVKNIGEVQVFFDDRMGLQYNTYLEYAKIDGVEYGDTIFNKK